MKAISPTQYGKDHWSLLAYVETRCVDYGGVLDVAHLRVKNPAIGMGSRHAPYSRPGWKPEYGTRLAGYWNKDGTTDPNKRLPDHDDLDCLEDLEAAGFIKNFGTGLNPAYEMTKLGNRVASLLREHKTEGKHYSSFKLQIQN